MNSAASKFLKTLVVVFLFIYVSASIFNSAKSQLETEEAVVYTVNENIIFDGVFVRNEEVITYNGGGIIDYLYPDGCKLSVSSDIANVYDSEQQIIAKNKIKELEKEVNDLERSQNPGTTNYAKPEALKSQIDEKYVLLASLIEKKDFESINKTKSDILMLMNIYNIVTQLESSYDARIDELRSKIKDYESQYSAPKATISTDHTGYFVSTTDGYESVVNIDNVDNIDVDMINKIINGEGTVKKENAIGKIFDSYSCKIVGVIKPTNKFLRGDSLKISLGNSKTTYDVTVDEIKKIDDEKCILILDCEAIDENISRDRVERIELIFKEFTGLKVPREAIRFKEAEETVVDENGLETTQKVEYKGVYVKFGQDITFKRIDVIYEGDDFVVSNNVSDNDYLNLYDQIILEEVKEKDVAE